ncbi:MAG: hypothetical protein MUF00_05555 [Gemmatimonadaceae bacterium]|jgi:hypothetical protein|nr:hypothetical protein [Gemmatimonadaceae bacterium]
MDCRRFRSQHLSYLDNTLCGQSTAAMRQHLTSCRACAAHDQLVRRSLVLARSLEPITPSAEFQTRLFARLRAEPGDAVQAIDDGVAGDGAFLIIGRGWQPSRRALAAVAASMMMMTTVAYYRAAPAREAARQAAVTPLPDPIPIAPVMSADFVGAVLSGNPVLPAAVMANQAPIDFLTGGVQPVLATPERSSVGSPVLSGLR